MIDTGKIEEAKRLMKKMDRPLIVKAKDDNFNRKILEYGKFDILCGIEEGRKERNLRNIDSGMNEFLASLASKNKVSFGIDMNNLRNMHEDERVFIIERIIQNVKICRKKKAVIRLLNFKDKKNAFSFMQSLGASTQQAKESIENFAKIIKIL